MRYLFDHRDEIEKDMDKSFIYLFLDFDGTLAPIAATPARGRLSRRSRGLLFRLRRIPCVEIAVVSGRSLKDIKRRVGIEGLTYVGNHGYEIEGPEFKFKGRVPREYFSALKEIKERLRERLAGVKGALIEDKGYSIGVHYRMVPVRNIPVVKSVFYDTLRPYKMRAGLVFRRGKKALEILPSAGEDKGRAILRLLARHKSNLAQKGINVLPVYIGDDTTDEDAFRALARSGLTIFVGRPKRSAASFFLKDVRDVVRFLSFLLEEKGFEYGRYH